MDTKTILAMLEAYGLPVVAQGFVPVLTALKAANPGATAAQLAANEDGTLKHFIRGKIGFFVDLIWPFINPTLDSILVEAAAIVDGQSTSTSSDTAFPT